MNCSQVPPFSLAAGKDGTAGANLRAYYQQLRRLQLHCWLHLLAVMVLLGLLFTGSGCQSLPSQVVFKSQAQLDAMTAQSLHGRYLFHHQENLVAARQLFAGLATERHASQPLFLCELASIALLQQDHAAAGQYLQEAVFLLEQFYDQATETQATSIWGSEAQKVYKGDPYERATLYMLYGLWFLENQDPETALICFKRGLLMDGDTEHATYQADYGLLFFLAAKCHDLMREPEQRDAMLLATFRAYMSLPGATEAFLQAAKAEYDLFMQPDDNGKSQGPSLWLRRIAGWADRWELEKLGVRDQMLHWLDQQRLEPAQQMHFNTLIIAWNGEGPTMIRSGKYGHVRLIGCLDPPVQPLLYGLIINQQPELNMLQGLGNVSFQASTRGGRRMDKLLASQAAIRSATDFSSSAMKLTGFALLAGSDHQKTQLTGLGLLLGGMIAETIGQYMNPQADIRCWQCLPSEFTIMPVQLPPGEHLMEITARHNNDKLTRKMGKIRLPAEKQINIKHLKGVNWQKVRY